MAFGTLGIVVVWTPVLLRDNGILPAVAGTALGIHGLGALIGIASVGRLMERFGTLPMLLPALLLGAVCTGALGYAATSVASMSTVLFLIGLFVGAGASGSIALATLTYPTAVRSSGIGWAMGMGRFGQVLAPLFTTAMIAMGWSGAQVFAMFGLAPALAALAVLALRRTTPRHGGGRVRPGGIMLSCLDKAHDLARQHQVGYKRDGGTTLFAALSVLDGSMIGRRIRRKRHEEFIRISSSAITRRSDR